MRELSLTKRVQVRFSELDPLKVVWHGNYVRYLEDAREEFGRIFGIGYSELVRNGYYAPVYDLHMRYEQPAMMDEFLLIKITFRPVHGAKMVFDYEIRREKDNALVMKATSIQLFETMDGEFSPVEPDFYRVWLSRVCYDFYIVDSCARTDSGYEISVSFRPDSEVYKGHFPGKPVAPGVCLMQMAKECYEYATGSLTKISAIRLCRFRKILDPSKVKEASLRLDVSDEEGRTILKASLMSGETEYMNMKAELSPE